MSSLRKTTVQSIRYIKCVVHDSDEPLFRSGCYQIFPSASPSNGRSAICTRLSDSRLDLYEACHPFHPPSSILNYQTVNHVLICPSMHCFNARAVSGEFHEERPLRCPAGMPRDRFKTPPTDGKAPFTGENFILRSIARRPKTNEDTIGRALLPSALRGGVMAPDVLCTACRRHILLLESLWRL